MWTLKKHREQTLDASVLVLNEIGCVIHHFSSGASNCHPITPSRAIMICYASYD
jgi:hypothetical protein